MEAVLIKLLCGIFFSQIWFFDANMIDFVIIILCDGLV